MTLYTGETKNGIKANGKINIPEFMHDTETDEIVFDISMEAETKEKDAAFKKFLKEKLLPLLRSKMSRFSADLIDAHKSDVYVEPENKIATNMTTSSYSPKPPAPDQFGVAAKPAGVVGGVAKISMSLEFVCSVADLYQTLTDANRVKMWTRGPANMEAFVTGNFSLFDGNISGSILELVKKELKSE